MRFIVLTISFLLLLLFGCNSNKRVEVKKNHQQYIIVLGIAQDAGFPHINCKKDCCDSFYNGNESKKMVSSIGLVDKEENKSYIFDATPDFTEQVRILNSEIPSSKTLLDGIFLTHAHIGHYTGLMYLGREALGGTEVPVYTMPKMKVFLEQNGPWSQLVSLKNIELKEMRHDSELQLNRNLKVIPFLVPHRDEFSETVGYKIVGKSKSAIFIPDIDKWEKWTRNIIEEVKKVDYAFLDASFFRDGEIDRDMSKIPHPFTSETTTLFENESQQTKSKIYFIHFNHSNPTIKDSHHLVDSIQSLGFNFAREGEVFAL